MNLIKDDSDITHDELVDGAVALLTGDSPSSPPENARTKESGQKRKRMELCDMFPSSGKLPNFKKKSVKSKTGLDKKKDEKREIKEWKKSEKRNKNFLVRDFFFWVFWI